MTDPTWLGAIHSRLNDLEAKDRRRPAADWPGMYDWTRIAAAVPPSTEVYGRPSYVWDSFTRDGWKAGAFTADFGLGGNCQVSQFTNADWYLGIILGRNSGGDLPIFWETEECETALEAEAAVELLLIDAFPWFLHLPIGMLVVRNNGRTTIAGQILPIDAINRGRSYIYVADTRSWLHVESSIE